jgi:purine-binding chemotaxis protein CheW
MSASSTPSSPPKIDWAALRSQVDAAQRSLCLHDALTGEQRRSVLQARARIAAVEPIRPKTDALPIELVEFSLLHETYGIEAAYVSEVICLDSYLPLPGAPACIFGVVPLRGRMLTIINLKPFFGLPAQGLTNLNKLIVLTDKTTEFGLLVDSVSGSLRRITEDALQAIPPTFTGVRAQFSRCISADSLVVLDAKRLLEDPRFTAGAT